ncbi:hypothetical protein M0802_001875 [Mischocyttarus mexicanus]|nr:hypothetical protein M0802_001875 [Mischocyttarus mexicanus]
MKWSKFQFNYVHFLLYFILDNLIEWMLIEWSKQHATINHKDPDHQEDPQKDGGIPGRQFLSMTQPSTTQALGLT